MIEILQRLSSALLTLDAQIFSSSSRKLMAQRLASCQTAITSAMDIQSPAHIATILMEDGSIDVTSSLSETDAASAPHTALRV